MAYITEITVALKKKKHLEKIKICLLENAGTVALQHLKVCQEKGPKFDG